MPPDRLPPSPGCYGPAHVLTVYWLCLSLENGFVDGLVLASESTGLICPRQQWVGLSVRAGALLHPVNKLKDYLD